MTTLPTQPFGPDAVPVSRIALGCMGLAGLWILKIALRATAPVTDPRAGAAGGPTRR